jgi:hypothetical protein
MEPLQEVPYTCPHCWQPNSCIVDLSAPPESLIEDCRVCCRPVRLLVSLSANGTADVDASPTE